MKILYEDDKMPVGKYKGKIVSDVVNKYPEYIRKFNENNIAFCDDIMLEVGRITSNTRIKNPRKYNSTKNNYHNMLNTKTT